jgi:1-acyl-sn-glycerol-3-phosphate acyltransferase
MKINLSKLRSIFVMTLLYVLWIIMTPFALIVMLLDPIKQRPLQPLIRLWGKASIFIMGLPVKVSGLENLKGLKQAVLVINHTSAVDIPLVLGYLPLRIGFLAKKQVVYIPLIGQILLLLGHILVDRSDPRKALKSIDRCISAYRRGISIALFPEGTRTRDGKVQPFKAGSLRIPARAEATVLPISIYGGHKVMRKNDLTIYKHPVYMHIGAPIESTGISKDKYKDYVANLEEVVRNNTEDLRRQVELDFPELSEDDRQVAESAGS